MTLPRGFKNTDIFPELFKIVEYFPDKIFYVNANNFSQKRKVKFILTQAAIISEQREKLKEKIYNFGEKQNK